MDDQKRLQKIDDELTQLGKLAVDSDIGQQCAEQRNAILIVQKKKAEVRAKYRKMKSMTNGELLDHGKQLEIQSKLALLANRINGLDHEIEYRYRRLGLAVAVNPLADVLFPDQLARLDRLSATS